jgi:hypothetical protein
MFNLSSVLQAINLLFANIVMVFIYLFALDKCGRQKNLVISNSENNNRLFILFMGLTTITL